MNPFSGDSFKKLKREWYEKANAADSGFKDIEDENGDFNDHQSVADFSQRIHFKTDIKESTESYYSWACEMLYVGVFKTTTDQKIWEMHSQGKSAGKICKVIPLERSWIIRKTQRIKKYLTSQEQPIRSVLPYVITDWVD